MWRVILRQRRGWFFSTLLEHVDAALQQQAKEKQVVRQRRVRDAFHRSFLLHVFVGMGFTRDVQHEMWRRYRNAHAYRHFARICPQIRGHVVLKKYFAVADAALELHLPLRFWFNRDIRLSIPWQPLQTLQSLQRVVGRPALLTSTNYAPFMTDEAFEDDMVGLRKTMLYRNIQSMRIGGRYYITSHEPDTSPR